ncbi:hypothetical protein N836_16850 [Leptolyngbya sp. Heron Island J]|uniref:DUF6883 domain-containing protein n=1 Tax=Leptolyngbya sp. Heron Island J TaxID=1385935 RepID=UPI0003B961AB|nr:DUF6883 domain-containing protein [Leptolyngbya sp. Heron Island J]ESA34445.1 hypothetical protein N836_16850 [Leptolyngbya sp. Heron Island J]
MQLPNYAQAYIQRNKLTGYLLSETHPIGKAKAKFFRNLKFDDTNLDILEQALLKLAQTQSIHETIETVHGIKYIIIGPIETPSSKTVTIFTVWIVDTGEDAPRFITARPYNNG